MFLRARCRLCKLCSSSLVLMLTHSWWLQRVKTASPPALFRTWHSPLTIQPQEVQIRHQNFAQLKDVTWISSPKWSLPFILKYSILKIWNQKNLQYWLIFYYFFSSQIYSFTKQLEVEKGWHKLAINSWTAWKNFLWKTSSLDIKIQVWNEMVTAKISVSTVCAVKRLKGSTPEWAFIGLNDSHISPALDMNAVKNHLPWSWNCCSRNWGK